MRFERMQLLSPTKMRLRFFSDPQRYLNQRADDYRSLFFFCAMTPLHQRRWEFLHHCSTAELLGDPKGYSAMSQLE
jgi:hypothetical protein